MKYFMSAWVIACVNCKVPFVHTKIDNYKLMDFLDPRKPEIAAGGVRVECPNCGHRGLYYRTDLTYRED
jgi:DNA-directed RNA polymerase subunit RPC12/RpoP